MYRIMVSFIMSLVGTQVSEDDRRFGMNPQSFADSFVNENADRQVRAANGIGLRGASTALVASLTVPVDELASIVAARLLRTAITQLSVPSDAGEAMRNDMEDFLAQSGVHPVLTRRGAEFAEPDPVFGARQVTFALQEREAAMQSGIASLRVQLRRDVPQLVATFDPERAVRSLLGRMDIFRAQRVVFGHPGVEDPIEQIGVFGLLQRRRAAPEPPPGIGAGPPPIPELRDGLFRRVRWSDEAPVAARAWQNEWYWWSTLTVWSEAWAPYAPQWSRPLDRLEREMKALTTALAEFARDDADFLLRSAGLYRKRVGVSYLLPTGTGGIEQFYGKAVRQLVARQVKAGLLQVNSGEASLVQTMIGPDGWRTAYEIGVERGPEYAVAKLREQVAIQIKAFLQEPGPGEQPMVRRLRDLLAQAAEEAESADKAGNAAANDGMRDYLDEFNGHLAGLVPGNFTPQGTGPMRVLVFYPAPGPNNTVIRHLGSMLTLPAGPRITYDYRNVYNESITVVMFRTFMGITDVPEVRDSLRQWAGATARPEPTDKLPWRQRTGYDPGYLMTREEDRVEILFRILCALWNGKGFVIGSEESPERIGIHLGGARITLPLSPLGQASSWGSLLRSYERYALDGGEINVWLCDLLMKEMPDGLNGPGLQFPHYLYLILRDRADGEIEILDEMVRHASPSQRYRAAQLRSFWADTLPAALDRRFTEVDAPVAVNLRELVRVVALSLT